MVIHTSTGKITNWNKYALDWLNHVFAIQGRPVAVAPTLFVTMVSVLAGFWWEKGSDEWRETLQIPTMTITLLGNALFFALAFRTNSCYSRWWQARSHWGMIINRTRDIAGQAHLWIKDPEISSCIVRHTVAFAYATMRHLRFHKTVPELADPGLVPAHVRLGYTEHVALEAADHMPLHALGVMRGSVREAAKRGLINGFQMKSMDENITSFQDQLGACEKILKTPFPWGYQVHLRTFMILWLSALPWILLKDFHLAVVPVTAIMAYALTGLEVLGYWMAHPFGLDYNCLPLEALCKTVHTGLAEIAEFREPHWQALLPNHSTWQPVADSIKERPNGESEGGGTSSEEPLSAKL